MTTFERVTAGGKTKTIRLVRESERFVWGMVVDKTGDEIAPRGRADQTLWVIEKSMITVRVALRMNLTYAELEDA